MKKCLNCGFESQEGNFCPKCGNGFAEVPEQPVQEQPVSEQIFVSEQTSNAGIYQAPTVVTDDSVSIGEWIITMLLSAIPCVNLVMLFVWAFGGGAKKSKSNWAKATLIFLLISVAFSLIIGIIMGIAGVSAINQMYY